MENYIKLQFTKYQMTFLEMNAHSSIDIVPERNIQIKAVETKSKWKMKRKTKQGKRLQENKNIIKGHDNTIKCLSTGQWSIAMVNNRVNLFIVKQNYNGKDFPLFLATNHLLNFERLNKDFIYLYIKRCFFFLLFLFLFCLIDWNWGLECPYKVSELDILYESF